MFAPRIRLRATPVIGALVGTALLVAAACGEEEPTPTAPTSGATPTSTPEAGAAGGGAQVLATPTPAGEEATPTPTTAGETVKRGGTLRTAHRRSPLYFRLDMSTTTDNVSNVTPVFNGLVAMQPPDFTKIGPDLAESWEVTNGGKTYTFHLASGVVDHNGNPWTSEDAKFWLEYMGSETKRRPPHQYVSIAGESIFESIETPDDTTLVVNLKQPNGLFLANMAQVYASMVPEDGFDEDASLTNPNGTGPWKVVKYIPAEKIEYEAFDQYFKEGLPYMERVEMFAIRDATARAAAFEAQRIDIVQMGSSHGIFVDTMKAISDRHPGEVTFYQGFHAVGRAVKYQFRNDGPWQDKRVRQAINLAINRDDVCIAIPGCFVGGWAPSPQFGITDREELSKKAGFAMPGPDKEAEVKKAQELMAEAGFADGFDVKVLCRDTNDYRDLFCPQMEFQLRDKLNINATLDVQETGKWDETLANGDWAMDFGSWGGMRVDHPFDWFDGYGFCGQGPRRNQTGYCNEDFDEILKTMAVTSDVDELQTLWDEGTAILDEDMPVAVGFWPMRRVMHWNYVKNVPNERFSGQYSQARRLEQVWLDK